MQTLEKQHYDRLREEQTREADAQRMINELKEEERNIAVRLKALQVHHEHIKGGINNLVRTWLINVAYILFVDVV